MTNVENAHISCQKYERSKRDKRQSLAIVSQFISFLLTMSERCINTKKEEWGKKNMTNEEGIGYALLACRDAGISKDVAEQLINVMSGEFDRYQEQEAKRIGFAWLYDSED